MDLDFMTDTAEGAVISVRAKPRSSKPGIDGVRDGALAVRIRSAPVDGKANKELVETLADAFSVPKSRIVFKSGETSKTKRILIAGIPAEEAARRLK